MLFRSLHIITHSLYSNKEIFLRELISNASDAINKIKFDSLQHEEKLEGNKDWKIKITLDRDNKTLTVSDNGIGLSRELAIENLGTIAHSGTRAFLEALKARDVHTQQVTEAASRFNQLARAKATLRPRAEILRFFDGLELLEPGLVQVHQWRPGVAVPGHNREAAGYCGLARKA